MSATEIAPSGGATITGNVHAGTSAGELHQTVTVKGLGEQLEIPIVGRVVCDIELHPSEVVLEPDFFTRTSASGSIRIANNGSTAIRIEEHVQLPEGVSLEGVSRTQLQPGDDALLRMMVRSTTVVGTRGRGVIRTSHPVERAVPFKIEVKPQHAVEVQPAAIRLGLISEEALWSLKPVELVVTGRVLDLVTVEAVETSAGYFDVPESSRDNEGRMVVTLRARQGGYVPIDLAANVRIAMSLNGSIAELSVPITGLLAKK